jgi:hypothetical protein
MKPVTMAHEVSSSLAKSRTRPRNLQGCLPYRFQLRGHLGDAFLPWTNQLLMPEGILATYSKLAGRFEISEEAPRIPLGHRT